MNTAVPIRVAQVIETLGAGGAERLLTDVARRLDPTRFECRILPLEAPLDLLPELEAARVAVDPILRSARREPMACLFRLASRLRAYRPAVVHTHLYFANVMGRLASCAVSRCRVVTSLHNPDYTFEAKPTLAFAGKKALDRLTARRNAAFVAVSGAVADDFRRHMGWRNMEVIYNGVDLQRYTPGPPTLGPEIWPEGGLRLLSTGRLHPQKGHGVLLEAMARCRDRAVGLSLALASRLGLGNRVRFLGRRSDIVALLRSADLFVFPSLYEAFGVALLEAMACGRPVLASATGGIPEIVEPDMNGVLTAPGDAVGLACAIERLARDAPGRARLGEAARRRAGDFDISRTVAGLERLYDRLVARWE
jgi:glycosyltransferase involved in cell wall biosynthesis